jgi:dihydrofolate synthase/folylpolyglutamate synthase
LTTWTLERAERHLLALELFGMRFGLDRMRRLLTALGSPQTRFEAVHVVGTNGKSSTVRMTAAILAAHGVRVGAYVSPHLITFAERIRIGDADLSPDAFGASVQRAAGAAAKVDRTLPEGDRVTQFELLTAAAFAALADHEVEVAVIEAGLGGRHDATNVIAAPVVALTNVALEHTKWLGPTIADIAREKLAVVPEGGTLVVGDLHREAEAEAIATAERQGARLVHARPAGTGFRQANLAVARAAAGALLGRPVDDDLEDLHIPGRLQIVSEDPLTILDGAHNPDGMAALVESLPEIVGERPLTAVVSVLDDKDAAGMLRTLLPACAAAVFTSSENPRALSPATLASLAAQLGGAGGTEPEIEPDPHRAVQRAWDLAGPGGAVLATGSIYLVADLLSPPGARRASTL